ncbi:MAG: carbon storage regulator [Lachnospiraceae bacterium]
MLRMSVKNGEYIMVGDDVKIVFLGGGAGQTRIMIDAPKEVNIARSRAIEKRIENSEILVNLPKYYPQEEYPEKYKKKSKVVLVRND